MTGPPPRLFASILTENVSRHQENASGELKVVEVTRQNDSVMMIPLRIQITRVDSKAILAAKRRWNLRINPTCDCIDEAARTRSQITNHSMKKTAAHISC